MTLLVSDLAGLELDWECVCEAGITAICFWISNKLKADNLSLSPSKWEPFQKQALHLGCTVKGLSTEAKESRGCAGLPDLPETCLLSSVTLLLFKKGVTDLSTFQSQWLREQGEAIQLLTEQQSVIRAEIISAHFSCSRWRHFKTSFILDVNIYIQTLQAVLMEEDTHIHMTTSGGISQTKKSPLV